MLHLVRVVCDVTLSVVLIHQMLESAGSGREGGMEGGRDGGERERRKKGGEQGQGGTGREVERVDWDGR